MFNNLFDGELHINGEPLCGELYIDGGQLCGDIDDIYVTTLAMYSWDDIYNKPHTFPPSAHEHPEYAYVADLTEVSNRLATHVENPDIHITPAERQYWNKKSRLFRNADGALIISN